MIQSLNLKAIHFIDLHGSSNVIHSCSGDVPTITADNFERNMRETLEEVCKNIPKLFVNLVLLGNISERQTEVCYICRPDKCLSS